MPHSQLRHIACIYLPSRTRAVFVLVFLIPMINSACFASGINSDEQEVSTLVSVLQTETAEASQPEIEPFADPSDLNPGFAQEEDTSSLERLNVSFLDEGRFLIVENETIKVVFDKDWGGAIREISVDGENMVNEYDGGRLIAVSFYDGATTEGSTDHPADTGWNPTPSDWLNNKNVPLLYSFENNTLHIQTRYIQWFPLDKGGGQGSPVPSDVIVDTWFSFVNDPRLMHIKYRMSYQGSEDHVLTQQEFPFAYIRSPFYRFVTYAGQEPWTNGDVTFDDQAPVFPDAGDTKTTEYWAGFVNDEDVGLLMYAPQNYSATTYNYFDNQLPAENSCFYMLPYAFLELSAGISKEINTFLYAGDWRDARQEFYALENSTYFPDILPPLGFLDSIYSGDQVSDVVDVSGWAFDNGNISTIEIVLDDQVIGQADHGHTRPDVAAANPTIAGGPNVGYGFALDTSQFSNGEHTLRVDLVDETGNRSVASPGAIRILINN